MDADDRLDADFQKWRFPEANHSTDGGNAEQPWDPSAEDAPAPPAGTSIATTDDAKPPARKKRTPQQLERQFRAFQLSVEGQSVRAIAKLLDISCPTVISDIRAEQELRAEEIEERRDSEKAAAIAFYQTVIAKALRKSEIADTVLGDIAKGAQRNLSDRYLDTALAARARIDKLLGIEAPAKLDVSVATLVAAMDVGIPE